MNTAPIVSKVWSFCTTLRDDGVPAEHNWQTLKSKRGAELEGHYITLLRELGTKTGMLGQICTKAQNKIQDPAKLFRLIDMVDDTEWVPVGSDIKGDNHWPVCQTTAARGYLLCG